MESAIDHAKRAFALKKFEQAVDHYATALELMYVASCSSFVCLMPSLNRTEKYGDSAPETADVYFSYGKALLENAISQASVLGKEQQEEVTAPEPNGKSFSAGRASVF
jgi:HAT1-interacting factor 1